MVTCEIAVAVFVRVWMFSFPSITSWLEERPEISTPNTSWKRVKEGLATSNSYNHQGNYYGSSLLLHFMKHVDRVDSRLHMFIFIACDVLIALALRKFVEGFLRKEFSSKDFTNAFKRFGLDANSIDSKNVEKVSHFVFMLYLFNPMTMFTCVSKTTVIFNNLFLSFFLLMSITGDLRSMTFFLALSTYETLYPVQLIIAACLSCWKYEHKNAEDKLKVCMVKGLGWFILWSELIFVTAALLSNPGEVFRHYEYILLLSDQTPNLGLFWYFFTEVFGHFESFFLTVFQLNVIFYSLPLSIKLRSQPIVLEFALLAVISIFKSYPVVGDTTLWIALIPMWSHTFMYMRDSIVAVFSIFVSCLICTVMWFAWITANAANANFYFATGLVFSMGQLYLLCDVVTSCLKWNYLIKISQSDETFKHHAHPPGAVLKLVN